MTTRWSRGLAALAALTLLSGGVAGCGGDSADGATVRLGYFPNITHAPALVGVQQGIFADKLGDDVTLETSTFNAGPAAVEALFSGAIDATYIGPNPAINGWAQSDGTALRIVAGSTSGGAGLVVADGIDGPEDLRGKKIATPQLGNTQDVALRAWLADNGLDADTEGGGEVSVVPTDNAEIVNAFAAGAIDGAWLPEPHLSRLVLEHGGTLLVDERDLWSDGLFVTTHLVVRAEFLDEHPDLVEKLLAGHLAAVDAINDDPDTAKQAANDQLEALSGKPLSQDVLDAAFANLTFTVDPIADSLLGSAQHAEAVGLLDPVDLTGIYALDPLNKLLTDAGRPPVSAGESAT